jgi:hypothetical protein
MSQLHAELLLIISSARVLEKMDKEKKKKKTRY